jgi:CheY-like chemotaxis protein
MIKVGLAWHGFEDPKVAFQNFKAGAYDLLLLDVQMKRIDGITRR